MFLAAYTAVMIYGSCIWSSGADAVYDHASFFSMTEQAWVVIRPRCSIGTMPELWSNADALETVQSWGTPDPILLQPGSICLVTGCRVYYDSMLGNEIRYVVDSGDQPAPYAALFVHRDAIHSWIARRETNKFPAITINLEEP